MVHVYNLKFNQNTRSRLGIAITSHADYSRLKRGKCKGCYRTYDGFLVKFREEELCSYFSWPVLLRKTTWLETHSLWEIATKTKVQLRQITRAHWSSEA